MARRRALRILAAAAAVYGLACADLWLRARRAYLEGEKYMAWHRDPALKRAFYDAALKAEDDSWAGAKAAGRIDDVERRRRLELARAARDEAVAESSLKYAVRWYGTCVELFAPPENRWVALSRERLAEAKRLWKEELDAAHIPRAARQLP